MSKENIKQNYKTPLIYEVQCDKLKLKKLVNADAQNKFTLS